MPYINIKITREGATSEQKAALIKGATQLLADVLHKNPKTTVVTIEEVEMDSWGIGGLLVEISREKAKEDALALENLKAEKESLRKELAELKGEEYLPEEPPAFSLDTDALKKGRKAKKKKAKHKK